jgi:hypothetical protein
LNRWRPQEAQRKGETDHPDYLKRLQDLNLILEGVQIVRFKHSILLSVVEDNKDQEKTLKSPESEQGEIIEERPKKGLSNGCLGPSFVYHCITRERGLLREVVQWNRLTNGEKAMVK